MAIATATALALAGTAVSAVSSIYSGIQQRKEAKKQAAAAQTEANRQSDLKRKEVLKLRAYQEANYAASGVTLDGSPLFVLDQTEKEGNAEADAIKRQGANNARAINAQGRDAMLSGFGNAAGSIGNFGYQAYQSGMFTPAKTTTPTAAKK